MTKNRGKKLLSLFMASVISASMLTVVGGPVSQVNAEEGDKQVACLGTSDINEPEPGETDKSWTGSFVWYGTYNGKPVRYRVLDPKTSKFGGTTMFLDCDSILYKAKFDEDGIANEGAANPNEWAYSDVRTGLNGSAFLEKAESFTDSEKAAIAYSNIISHKLNAEGEVQVEDWTKDTFEDYVALEDDKVFLLDMEDISNNAYGYSVVDDLVEYRIKKSDSETDLGWWSRSAIKSLSNYVGGVFPYGAFTGGSVDKYYGVSPAFNVNLESVIFSSIIPETAGEKYADYKLTLLDGDITVAVQSGKKIEVNGDKVTVPYAISGANNTHATQISVLILDKDYQKANANDAEILYYGKLDVKGIFSTKKGEGTFEFPSELDKSKWGTDYQVYLLAEDVNGEKKSDYASEPVKLDIPEALVDYTVTVTNDGNGTAEASVEKGTEGTEVTLTATPKSGYQFKEWQVISGGVTINDNKFKIGNANVEIKAVFEPISFTVEPTPTPEVEPTPDITRDANDISPSNPVKVDEIEKTILSIKDEKDTAGSTFTLLKAKGTPKSKKSIKLFWAKVPGAEEYIIYGNKCGKKNKYQKIATVKGTSYTAKKLKKGTYYKYTIVAVKGDEAIATSKAIHVTTDGGKKGNNTKVKLSKTKLSLNAGKSKKIKATLKYNKKVASHRKVAWESDNVSIATVKNGKITAVGKGTCYVYAYAQNGVSAKIKVTVK